MNLKDNLKALKLNESTISMIIGVVVILIVGVLVIRYFRNLDDNSTLPPVSTEEAVSDTGIKIDAEGRKVYTVVAGDTLWIIAEKQYKSGFNWSDIAAANNLESPGDIEEGQELIIPVVVAKQQTVEEVVVEESMEVVEDEEPTETEVPEPEETETPVVEETEEPKPVPTLDTGTPEQISEEGAETSGGDAITGDKYTVVRGDSLWVIAERAYGDGLKWVEIAEANELANPNLIHAGNEFTLPR